MTATDTPGVVTGVNWGNRPEYLVQNKGEVEVKFDFSATLTFADDDGFILAPDEAITLNGRMAKLALWAITDTGASARILIANPGPL